MKRMINEITPPIIKKFIKSVFKKPSYSPEWVILSDGFTMYLDKNTELFHFYNKGLDPYIYKNLEKELSKKNLIVFDLGAYFGYHTLKFAHKDNVKHVYAFEPNPDNRERLVKNIKKNPGAKEKITIIDKAISNEKGTSVFLAFNDIEQGVSSASLLQKEKSMAKRNDTLAREITVNMDTLDNLIGDGILLPPNIIKLDIEGAEYDALEGSRKLLLQNKPVLMIEVHTILNMYQLAGFFSEIDYQYYLIHTEKDGRVFVKAYTRKKNG
jgi:FkbM family methyltransferase